jgi:hypothetical protein
MGEEPDEVEELDPRETVCPLDNLAYWAALGACPTCDLEGRS